MLGKHLQVRDPVEAVEALLAVGFAGREVGASIGDGADVRELSVVGFGTPVAAGDHLAGAVRPEPSDWDI